LPHGLSFLLTNLDPRRQKPFPWHSSYDAEVSAILGIYRSPTHQLGALKNKLSASHDAV